MFTSDTNTSKKYLSELISKLFLHLHLQCSRIVEIKLFCWNLFQKLRMILHTIEPSFILQKILQRRKFEKRCVIWAYFPSFRVFGTTSPAPVFSILKTLQWGVSNPFFESAVMFARISGNCYQRTLLDLLNYHKDYLFLKCYSTKDVLPSLFGIDSTSYREEVCLVVRSILGIFNIRFFNLNAFELIIQI